MCNSMSNSRSVIALSITRRERQAMQIVCARGKCVRVSYIDSKLIGNVRAYVSLRVCVLENKQKNV